METAQLPMDDSTFFAPAENAASNPGGVQPNETEQQLRRRLIQFMAELSMQLEHACLMDLVDYALGLSACSRAALAK